MRRVAMHAGGETMTKKVTLKTKGGGNITFTASEVDAGEWLSRAVSENGDMAERGYEFDGITVSRLISKDNKVLELYEKNDQTAYFEGEITWFPAGNPKTAALIISFTKGHVCNYRRPEEGNKFRETFTISVSDTVKVNNSVFHLVHKQEETEESA